MAFVIHKSNAFTKTVAAANDSIDTAVEGLYGVYHSMRTTYADQHQLNLEFYEWNNPHGKYGLNRTLRENPTRGAFVGGMKGSIMFLGAIPPALVDLGGKVWSASSRGIGQTLYAPLEWLSNGIKNGAQYVYAVEEKYTEQGMSIHQADSRALAEELTLAGGIIGSFIQGGFNTMGGVGKIGNSIQLTPQATFASAIGSAKMEIAVEMTALVDGMGEVGKGNGVMASQGKGDKPTSPSAGEKLPQADATQLKGLPLEKLVEAADNNDMAAAAELRNRADQNDDLATVESFTAAATIKLAATKGKQWALMSYLMGIERGKAWAKAIKETSPELPAVLLNDPTFGPIVVDTLKKLPEKCDAHLLFLLSRRGEKWAADVLWKRASSDREIATQIAHALSSKNPSRIGSILYNYAQILIDFKQEIPQWLQNALDAIGE